MRPLSVQFRVRRQFEATTENSWKVPSHSPAPHSIPRFAIALAICNWISLEVGNSQVYRYKSPLTLCSGQDVPRKRSSKSISTTQQDRKVWKVTK